MTIIAGLMHGEEAYMASDGRISAGSEILNCSTTDHKIFQIGKMVIGCAGTVRTMQVIRDNLKLPVQGTNQNDRAYLSVVFAKAMEDLYKEAGTKDSDKIHCILGYNSKIYRVATDWAITEPVYTTVGSGAHFARGALVASFMLKTKLSPEKRLRLAVDAAAQCDSGCGDSFYMVKVQ
jgi:ATP-dependent protease HslVU (ClpYQ) peptidase subunit